MRIAISTDGDMVSAHFGRCPVFTVADIEEGKIVKKTVLANPGHSPGAIPEFLHAQGVTCIIAGGMGQRAAQFFQEHGIETIVGAGGGVDDALKAFAAGSLKSGASLCAPGSGKGYGVEKTVCDHTDADTER